MALLVQKFGGTSVGSLERIQHVADLIMQARGQGHDVVVVSSAMNGETDRLIQLGAAVQEQPNAREYDVLVSTGEQVAVALLSIALNAKGCPSRSIPAPKQASSPMVFIKKRVLLILIPRFYGKICRLAKCRWLLVSKV